VYFREAPSQLFRGKKNSAQVVDLSLGGFRIYSDEPMKQGQQLKLDLVLPSGETVACEVAVAWVRPLPPGEAAAYDVGLGFLGASQELLERVSAVLDTSTEPSE
jgi:hypothetical protein